MTSNWQQPVVQLPVSLFAIPPIAIYYQGYMLSSQQHTEYKGQGQLDSSINHFSCMKGYWGENIFVCQLADECSVWNGVQFCRQTQAELPQPTILHTSNGQMIKHRHHKISAKARFWMTASRKCSGAQGLCTRIPQNHGPGSLTWLCYIAVFLELLGTAKTPQSSLTSHGGQPGRELMSNKFWRLQKSPPINKKTC